MGRMVSAKTAKQFGRLVRAWILFAGCTAVASYVVDAEYGAERLARVTRWEPVVMSPAAARG
jgi:hypothetical protein